MSATGFSFDAAEYPGTGTIYTDPSGDIWTLSASGAIVPEALSTKVSQWDSALRSDFTYIPEDLDPPSAILYARDVSHTEAEVAFDPLSIPVDPNFGAPKEIALVRSPSGFPATLLDGNMVRRHPPEPPDNDGWVRIPDTGLTPGTWYYYGLFGKYFHEGNTFWLRVGEKSVLLPQEYLSADHLWERVPEWYRRADMDPGGTPGVLRRLVDTIGYTTDVHRTWAYTVGDVWDAEKISADLLPWLGDTLGQPVEYAAGDERYRSLLSNILPLRKLKGTEHGTEAYLSAITGYRTRVYSGLNMLPTVDEAEAKYSSGLWTGTLNSTLTRVLSTGAPAGSPAAGTYYHRLTYNTTTSQKPALRLGNGTDLTRMIPVTGGHQFKASAFFRSSFTGTWTVRFVWRAADGSSAGADSTVNMGAIGTTWIRRTAPAVTAPTGAAFAEINLELSVATTVAGLVVEVTDILVADLAWRPEDVPGSANTPPLSGTNPGEYDDVGYYEPPRTVHVNVYPQRINYALNSDFRMSNIPAGAWTVAERATWGLLPQAYSSWGDIHDAQPGDSEANWGDLAEGFEPLGGDWGVVFDTSNNRLVLDPAGKVTSIVDQPSYLAPSATASVTTPDPGVVPAECTFVFKVRQTGRTPGQTLVGQFETLPTLSWLVQVSPDEPTIYWIPSANGTNFNVYGSSGGNFGTDDEWRAISVKIGIGGASFTTLTSYESTDGQTWTELGHADYNSVVPLDVSTVMRIGYSGYAASPFLGRIYSVEMRSGLGPTTPADRYLTPTIGTVSTPDPGVLPADCVFVYTVQGPTGGVDHCVAAQWQTTATNRGWALFNRPAGNRNFNFSRSGVDSFSRTLLGPAPTGAPEKYATVLTNTDGIVEVFRWTGTAWVSVARTTSTGTALGIFDSTLPVRIGATSSGNNPFDGRIYSVECRTGTNPDGGTLLWRFDANDAPTDATTTSWIDPRGRTWTSTSAQAISGRTVWRFDAAEYPGTGTNYTDPRGRTWTLSTAGAIVPKVMKMNYVAQVQSHFVPVVPGDSLSAAFLAWASVEGVQITLAVQFFTDDGPQYGLSINGVRQEVHGAPRTLKTTMDRYELRNAVIPEGAAFARVVIETTASVDYSAYLAEALIENAQIPGPYFNGDEVDGAYGDFFFTGQPHESYSVYYQNYRSFINDAGGSDRITSLMDELLPMETDFVLRTAAFGLYD